MKFKHIKSLAIICSTIMLAACTDNAWNDTYLDGFTGEASYNQTVTVQYTLTPTDYETIGKALAAVATTPEEQAAAKAIQTNHYFDQLSPYPAQIAVPYFLNTEGSDYYIYNNGSVVEVALKQAEVPEEVRLISASKRLVLPETTKESAIPSLLSEEFPDAEEGDYAIVSYNNGDTKKTAPTNSNLKNSATRADEDLTSNIKNLAKGQTLTATAMVTAQSERGLILTDNAGSIFYYCNNVDLNTYKIGTIVKVSGTVDEYGTGFQLPTQSTLTVVGQGSYSYPSPKVYSPEMIQAAIANTDKVLATYVSFEGELSISGNYYNINIPGVTNGQGSLYSPTSELKAKIESGKTYTFVGYFTGITSSKYFYMVLTDVKAEGDNPGDGGSTPLTSNIKNVSVGEKLTATAVVSGQCTRGLILTDNAGSILYYNTGVSLSTYPIGTVVDVEGEISDYNHGFQLSNTATLSVKGSETYSYPSPVAYDGDMVTAACAGTSDILATYVSVDGVVTFSGNYTNIAISGTSIVGSAYYITDEIKARLKENSSYRFFGYFTSFSSSYFYIVVTDVEEIVPEVDESTLTNAIYTFNGSAWELSKEAVVMNPVDYEEMGLKNNGVTDPGVYIPIFLKEKYPYASAGTVYYVAYNLTGNGCSCGIFTYDGYNWIYTSTYVEDKVAAYSKSNGAYKFLKYIGEEVFVYYPFKTLALDCTYVIVAPNGLNVVNDIPVGSSFCANPVAKGSGYGYLEVTPVDINDEGMIVLPNGDNSFTFLTEVEVNGTNYETPKGTFVIKDSNGRFIMCKDTYNNFNVYDNPYIENNAISQSYLFTATRNADGTWKISNTQIVNGEPYTRSICYSVSDKYQDFANYTDSKIESDGATLPYLFITQSQMPEDMEETE